MRYFPSFSAAVLAGLVSVIPQATCLPKKGSAQDSRDQARGASSLLTSSDATGGNAASKISTASDGSIIMDTTASINNLQIRFKVSAPADQFKQQSGVPGAAAAANATGTMGLNVLLHGDGGQSFFDFPNQAVQQNLMGVVALAPNKERFWGGGSGLNRTDGVPHSAAVNSLVQDVSSRHDYMFNMLIACFRFSRKWSPSTSRRSSSLESAEAPYSWPDFSPPNS